MPDPDTGPSGVRRRASLVRVACESTALVDAAAVVITALTAEKLYSGLVISVPLDFERAGGIGLLAAVGLVGIYGLARLYRTEAILRPDRRTVQRAVIGWGSVLLALIVAAFLTKTSANFSRGWGITWAVSAAGAICLGRLAVRSLVREVIGRGNLARHVAIVGAGQLADRLASYISARQPELVLIGVFDDRHTRRSDEETRLAPLGTVDDLIARGQTQALDEVIVTVPMQARERVQALIDRLAVLPVDIRICPGLAVIEGTEPTVSYLDDAPLISALKRPIGEWAWLGKTVFDRTASAFGLIVLAPLLGLIALAIKLDSRGPVLFRQRRHGFNHEVISVLKFRTMTVLEDGPTVTQASKDDTRVTRVGRFLRRTSLDELPQLWNVLTGGMSLVGPRPHALVHNEHYAQIIGHYANRHRVKPGITGLAQVNGLRGETDTPDKMAARIKLDLYYIDNWSMWLDFWIILRTIIFLAFQRTAY